MNVEAAAAEAVDSNYERVCWRLAGFDGRVSPEWIDGFLTGVLAGPRAIALDQWLPAMLGDGFARVFADPLDARQAQRALSSRWSELAQQLDAEVLVDDPNNVYLAPWIVAYEDADREAFVTQGFGNAEQAADELRPGVAWSRGFMAAVEHFAGDWVAPPLDADDAQRFHGAMQCIRDLQAPASRASASTARPRRADRSRLPGRAAPAPVLGGSRAEAIDAACRGAARPQRSVPLRQRLEIQEVPRCRALTPRRHLTLLHCAPCLNRCSSAVAMSCLG
jgi:hypothetical protein